MDDPTLKRCTKCGLDKPRTEFGRASKAPDGLFWRCKPCSLENDRRWREANPEQVRARNRRYTEIHREAARERRKRSVRLVRKVVLIYYSPAWPPDCACCGTTEGLTIDHVNGGGNAHRSEVIGTANPGSQAFYRWLVTNSFPPGYQVLCLRCNSSKGASEHCRLRHSN